MNFDSDNQLKDVMLYKTIVYVTSETAFLFVSRVLIHI